MKKMLKLGMLLLFSSSIFATLAAAYIGESMEGHH